MLKKSYFRILLVFGMVATLFFVSCVDTGVQPIPSSFDFQSQVAIVNLADGINTADFTLTTHSGENISFGAIPFGEQNSEGFKNVPAGSKTLSFNSESFKLNTEVDKKMRLFAVGSSTERSVVKFTERYTFQTKDDPSNNFLYRNDTAAVAFANGSTDLVITGIHAVSGTDTTALELSLELGDISGYQYLKAGNYSLDIFTNNSSGDGDTLISTFQAGNLAAKGRYTAVVFDKKVSLKSKVFVDD